MAHDSLLYVYDVPQSRIVVLDAQLRPVRSFGRRGRGPGEMEASVDKGQKGTGWQWVGMAGDTLAVFDGIRVQLFSSRGTFQEQRLSELTGSPELSERMERIEYNGKWLIGSRGGYDLALLQSPSERYRWYLIAHGPEGPRRLLMLKLQPLPTGTRGVPFRGPLQARPLWDFSGGCVVATDGTGAWLVRTSLGDGNVDTLDLALPRVKAPEIDPDDYSGLIGMASKGQGSYLAPTAVRKLSGLVIDPDGYVWLLPTQDSTHVRGGVEVVRIALSTGAAERDTVPAFPTAFGEPGVYYARTNDRHSGEATVTRYDRASSANR